MTLKLSKSLPEMLISHLTALQEALDSNLTSDKDSHVCAFVHSSYIQINCDIIIAISIAMLEYL